MMATCVCISSPVVRRNWRGARALFKCQFGVPLGQFRDRGRQSGTTSPSVAHQGIASGPEAGMTAGVAIDEKRRVALAFVALVLGAVAMGASVLFVRWADVGPYASAFWRVFLALPFLWAWMRLDTRPMGTARLWSDPAVWLPGACVTWGPFFREPGVLGGEGAEAP